MRQQTVLILDSQQHRGSMLERGLTGRGFHVFRTSRSREASKLLHILQPHFVVLAWEGEGRDFYQQVVWEGQLGASRCVVLSAPSSASFREGDVVVDVRLNSAHLLDEIVRAFSASSGSTTPRHGTPVGIDDKTMLAMQAVSPPPSGVPISHALKELEQWDAQPSPSAVPSAVPLSTPSRQISNEPMSLQPLDVARSLAVLAREQATGRVEIQTQKEKCWLGLAKGAVVAVQSIHPIFSFPAWLVQRGILSQQDAVLMTDLAKPGAPQRLLALQRITPEQLPAMEQMYAEQCILSCFPWTQGQFQFFPGESTQVERTLSLPLATLVLQGVRQGYSRERLLELVGGDTQIPRWISSPSPEKFLPLGDMERKAVSLIDGTRSLQQIKVSAACPTEALFGVVYVLNILGWLGLQGGHPITSSPAPDTRRPGASGTRDSTRFGGSRATVPPQSVGIVTSTGGVGTAASTGQVDASGQVGAVKPQGGGTPELSKTFVPAPAVSFRSVVGNARPGTMQMRSFSPQIPASVTPLPELTLGVSERDPVTQMFQQVLVANYFQILGVSQEANEAEIRRSYQQLKHTFARERFANPLAANTEEQLQEIRQVLEEAYTVLSDPPLRHLYLTHLAPRVE